VFIDLIHSTKLIKAINMTQVNSNLCSQCRSKGTKIDNATIKSLISVSLHRVEDIKHFFCANPNCSVVYFAEDGSETFYSDELRERVYQKEPNANDVLVCYCFFHTLGDIHSSLIEHDSSWIVDDINEGIQRGHCACDWRNPQGTCCLGNVLKIVKVK
jgi:hypothetical protein